MRNNWIAAVITGLMLPASIAATHGFYDAIGHATENRIQAISVFGTDATRPSPTPAIASHIVISEVQLNSAQSANDDFIELYNPTSGPVPLNGMRLVKRTSTATVDSTVITFTTGTIIPAHGFFLWGHKAAGEPYADTIGADASSSATLAANNSIAVKDISTGAVVDAFAWGAATSPLREGTAFTGILSAGQSMERKARSDSTTIDMAPGGVDELRGNGYDNDANSTDFIIRAGAQPQRSTSPPEVYF